MVTHRQLLWAWLRSSRGEVSAIILALVLAGVLLFILIKLPDVMRQHDWGFGPGWECRAMPYGDPVCVKKPGASGPDTTQPSK